MRRKSCAVSCVKWMTLLRMAKRRMRLPPDRSLLIAILTFDGFNELDSFIALGIVNRVKKPG